MRVLKKGTLPGGWEKELVCTGAGNGNGGCRAELLVGMDDLFGTESHHYDGSTEYYTTFMCPECGVLTDLSAEDRRALPTSRPLPKHWDWVESRGIRSPDTLVAVDALVTLNGCDVVLIEREKEPFRDKLVLPGGHVEKGERALEACVRELREEIGLAVEPSELALLTVLDAPDRDPRFGRRVSLVYKVELTDASRVAGLKAGSDARALHVRPIASLREEEVGFDHWEAILRVR